ncbi:MAG: fasciclin domain-containing protein [Pseudomonadota bacterium]
MTNTLKMSFAAILLGATALSACETADDTLPAGEEPAAVTEAVAEAPPLDEVVEAAEAEAPSLDEVVEAAEAEAPSLDEVVEAVEAEATIVAVAVATEDLSTLVAAVTAAGLVDTLNSEGPFTVFAPPNSAFDKLPDGTVASLLEPDQKDALTGVLTYHVVSGEVMAADLVAAIQGEDDGTFEITTVNGATLVASIVEGAPILTDAAGNTAAIIATDIDASNGVVHLIDTVVMPG